MELIILAGGLGTRLQKVVPDAPKALAPIRQVPFLGILLKQIEESGVFSKIILSLGFRSAQIIEYLKSISLKIPVMPLIESEPLGTGGAILHALKEVRSETFAVMNGDSYSDFSFFDLHEFHQSQKADVSIACYEVDDTSRYGRVVFDAELRIQQFLEKVAGSGWISRGICLFQKSIFESIDRRVCSLETELFPLFVKKRCFAYPALGTFIDIGTEDSFLQAQQLLENLNS